MRFSQGFQCIAMPVSYDKKWKGIVDYGDVFCVILTDLSKTFDFIPYDLFNAKLETYGFLADALNLVYDYLYNGKQRVKSNETFSCWKDIEYERCSTRI